MFAHVGVMSLISVEEPDRDVVVLKREVSQRARAAVPPAEYCSKDTRICLVYRVTGANKELAGKDVSPRQAFA